MKSETIASSHERRRLAVWILGQYRLHLVYSMLVALPLALFVQAFLFGANYRFLYGYWAIAGGLFAGQSLFRIYRSRTATWLARNRAIEPLWLLNHLPMKQWKTSEAIVWARQQALPPAEAKPVPWGVHFVTAILFACALQIPLVLSYTGWVVAGQFGPVLTVQQKLIADELWVDIPPEYTGLSPRPLAVANREFSLYEDATLRLEGRALTALPISLSGPGVSLLLQRTGDRVTGQLPVSRSTVLALQAAGRGLKLRDPTPIKIRVLPDKLPETSWLYADDRLEIDVDDVWKMRLHYQDRFGLVWAGYAIADETGKLVTETVSTIGTAITDISFRMVPEMFLDQLQSGIWRITPIAMDNKPGRLRPGYGTSVTVQVMSRFDRHKERLATLDVLFQYALGVLADLWENKPLRQGLAITQIRRYWRDIAAIEKDFWSPFGYDKMLAGTHQLLSALEQLPVNKMLFEKGVRALLRGRALENQANVADQVDAIQRSEQDLMAALADENASDREMLQLLAELQKKMQSLAKSMQNKNQILPQESYNKEALKPENLRENQDSLRSVLKALRKGDRRAAMDMLSRMMEKVDQMQAELDAPPQSGDSGSSQDQEGQENSTSKGLREAQRAIRKGIASQTRALEKDRNLGTSPSQTRQVRDQADATGKILDKVGKKLEKLDKGGMFERERKLVGEAQKKWKQGQQSLPQPGGTQPDNRLPGRGQFREQGENSLRLMRKAARSLQEKESRQQNASRKRDGQRQPRDEKVHNQKEKNQLADTRRQVLKNFSEGLPSEARPANRDYFKQLVK